MTSDEEIEQQRELLTSHRRTLAGRAHLISEYNALYPQQIHLLPQIYWLISLSIAFDNNSAFW